MVTADCNDNVPPHNHPGQTGSRPEPFPPAPPVLEREPVVRLMRQQGFPEVDYNPDQRIPASLTNAEIRTLAQHHLDRACYIIGYMRTGGCFGSSDLHISRYHQARYGELRDLLPEAEQKAFDEIVAIRNEHLDSLENQRRRGRRDHGRSSGP